MAEVPAKQHVDDPNGAIVGYHWPGVTEADTCGPVRITRWDDFTLSVHGTMGSASYGLSISNEAETTGYFVAKDANTGAAIALTVADTASLVSEAGMWYKPVRTGGSSSVVDVMLVGK